MPLTPTNYTEKEGGDWLATDGVDLSATSYAAVMFSDGSVWDEVSKYWRNSIDRAPYVPDKSSTPKPKNAGGRPTDYRIEYCDNVVNWGTQGKSKAWMAGELDCTIDTINNWCKANPEFLSAMEIAVTKSQQWWEDAGQNGMLNKSIDASIYSRSMAARFPRSWRESTENTTTLNKGDGWDAIFGAVVNTSRTI